MWSWSQFVVFLPGEKKGEQTQETEWGGGPSLQVQYINYPGSLKATVSRDGFGFSGHAW